MKELSIEEKAKRYDEAIERAKKQLDGAKVFDYEDEQTAYTIRLTTTDIFPELKESEDERTWIINYLSNKILNSTIIAEKENLKKAIAWLERKGEQEETLCDKCKKEQPSHSCQDITALGRCALEIQGKKKPADKVEPFDIYKGLTDFERTLADICIGWIGEEYGWKQYIKDNADVLLKIAIKKFNSVQDAPFKQKSAWSEEDEIAFDDALWCCEQAASIAKDDNDIGNVWYVEDWLKSIKDRYTWKPSDEQMAALNDINVTGSISYARQGQELINLYNDLKKLKG